MNVLIVAQQECCPAVVACRSELIDPAIIIVKDDYTYGIALAETWKIGEQFINLEHDVVPWPGALQALWECQDYRGWCGYDYIAGYSGVFNASLGCVKFSQKLIDSVPNAYEGWEETSWQSMDAAVFGSIPLPRDNPRWHTHYPPVAHLTPLKRPNVESC